MEVWTKIWMLSSLWIFSAFLVSPIVLKITPSMASSSWYADPPPVLLADEFLRCVTLIVYVWRTTFTAKIQSNLITTFPRGTSYEIHSAITTYSAMRPTAQRLEALARHRRWTVLLSWRTPKQWPKKQTNANKNETQKQETKDKLKSHLKCPLAIIISAEFPTFEQIF